MSVQLESTDDSESSQVAGLYEPTPTVDRAGHVISMAVSNKSGLDA